MGLQVEGMSEKLICRKARARPSNPGPASRREPIPASPNKTRAVKQRRSLAMTTAPARRARAGFESAGQTVGSRDAIPAAHSESE